MQRNRSTLSFIFLITLILTGVWTFNSSAQSNDEPETILSAPLPGQAVQGLIQITGELELENYSSYELSFSFSGHDTWFPITTDNTISENNLLGEWDTSAITDGNYDLKISVYFNEQGKILETKFVKLLMNKECNAAALNVIKGVKWKPAKKEGKPVKVWYDVPVVFKLE